MNDQTSENEQIVERTDLQFHQSKLLEKQQKLERLYLNNTLKRSYLSPVRPFRQILKIVYWTITFQIADRLKRRQIAHLIGRSGLFDTGYYYRQNPEVEALGIDPLGHYLDVGAASGRNPHPLFDTEYYLKTCPEAADSGMNPLGSGRFRDESSGALHNARFTIRSQSPPPFRYGVLSKNLSGSRIIGYRSFGALFNDRLGSWIQSPSIVRCRILS